MGLEHKYSAEAARADKLPGVEVYRRLAMLVAATVQAGEHSGAQIV